MDSCIDEISEGGDACLEEAGGDIHDAGELENGDLRRLVELADRVYNSFFGDARVGVDDQNVVTNANIAFCPCSPQLIVEHLGKTFLIRYLLLILGPNDAAFDLQQLVFHLQTDSEDKVHIRRFLELASPDVSLQSFAIRVVFWPGYPADVMGNIVFSSYLSLFR